MIATGRMPAPIATSRLTLSQNSVNLPAGGYQEVTVSLTGSLPAPGAYEGFIDVTGSGPALHLPYLYLAGDGIPYDIFPIMDGGFVAPPNDYGWRIAFRVVDQYGVPVANTPASFRILAGGGKLDAIHFDSATDILGTASIFLDVGNSGDQVFTGTACPLGTAALAGTGFDVWDDAGATGWLVKPFEPDQLLKVVRRVLPGS